jgi:ribosomal protein S18 acetylase RimI-like enzyme
MYSIKLIDLADSETYKKDSSRIVSLYAKLDQSQAGFFPPCTEKVSDYFQIYNKKYFQDKDVWIIKASRGRIIGFVEGRNGRKIGKYFINAVYVEKRYRRQGLGRCLLETVFDCVAGLGFTEIRIGVFSDNDSAKKLYESVGFKTCHESLIKILGNRRDS